MKGLLARVLGAAVVVRGVSGLLVYGALLAVHAVDGRGVPIPGVPAFALWINEFWLQIGWLPPPWFPDFLYSGALLITLVTTILDGFLIRAGLTFASRRPSLRLWSWRVLVPAALIYGVPLAIELAVFLPQGASLLDIIHYDFGHPWVFTLALIAAALAYLVVTRNDPELLPRTYGNVVMPEPGETQRLVTPETAAASANWKEALLASLGEAGVEPAKRPPSWPTWVGIFVVALIAIAIRIAFELGARYVSAEQAFELTLAANIALLILFGVPYALLRSRASRIRAKRAEDRLGKSRQRPLLYLRSFTLDEVIGQPSMMDLLSEARQFDNPEQALTRIAGKCGPVIAIGRPGEALPSLGAARFYVSHQLWQQKVADVVEVAPLTIWASGTTPGLQWELTHLIRSSRPEKLILWAHPHLLDLDPDEREAEWSRFVDGLGTLFPKALPKPLGDTRFFAFDRDFNPVAFGKRRLLRQRAQPAALRELLRAKEVPPFDPATIRKWVLAGRAAAATAAIALMVSGYLVFDYFRTAPPRPAEWDELAFVLLVVDRLPSHVARAPRPGIPRRTTNDVVESLDRTVDTNLHWEWFEETWNDVPPGRLGVLQASASKYRDLFKRARDLDVTAEAFYGEGASLAELVSSDAEAQDVLQALGSLATELEALGDAWSADRTGTANLVNAGRLRDLIAARRRLIAAEIALLRFAIADPGGWGANGATGFDFQSEAIREQARGPMETRAAATSTVAKLLVDSRPDWLK